MLLGALPSVDQIKLVIEGREVFDYKRIPALSPLLVLPDARSIASLVAIGRQKEGETAYRSSSLSANERVVGDGERNDVIPCQNCGQKLRVPSGMTLVVNCVKCQKRFVYP